MFRNSDRPLLTSEPSPVAGSPGEKHVHWLTRLPRTFLSLVFILAIGLTLRLYGIDWDSGFGFHPDERDIYMRSGCMYDLLTEAPGHQECGYLSDQPGADSGLPGLGTLLNPDQSPLNPHWFPLGSILIYVMVFFRSIIELFTDINALDMRFTGRTLSALADVGSIFLIYVLGRRMFSNEVGLLAAAFTALSVIHIQNSHFYRPETFSVFFTLASFCFMLRMLERRRLRDSALLGLMLGLALAPKVNVLPLVIPCTLAYWYRVLDLVDGRWVDITPAIVQRVLGHAAIAVIVAVGVFFVITPYALLDFSSFMNDLFAQARMARNAGLWPFTIQYIDAPPFLYQFQQISIWGLGLPLGVMAWLGIPFTAVMVYFRHETRRNDLLLLSWVVPGFLLTETFEVRFLRYVFPFIPFLILMASRMLWMLLEWTQQVSVPPGHAMSGAAYPDWNMHIGNWSERECERVGGPQSSTSCRSGYAEEASQPATGFGSDRPDDREMLRSTFIETRSAGKHSASIGIVIGLLWAFLKKGSKSLWRMSRVPLALSQEFSRPKLTWLAVGLVAAVLGTTAFYALAFERVYSRDHPAVTASQWINNNIPAGTALVSDNHWDEFVPNLYSYNVWQFPVYNADTSEKMDVLSLRLSRAEYLIFYSQRPYSSVARDPERFPLSVSYYQRLFSGDLGYRLDRTFTSYPELAGIAFKDEPSGRAGLPKLVPLTPEKTAPVSLYLGYADDNVVGYDHPKVMLFRNVDHLDYDEIRVLLNTPQARDPVPPNLGLMLSDEHRNIQQAGGTWSSIIDRDGWANHVPIIAWLLVVELAFLVSLPISMFIFRPLPDRGIILARIIGLLGVSYVAWLAVSLGWFDFSRIPVILGFLLITSLSAVALLVCWNEIKEFLKQNWRLVLIGEALFLTAFLAFVALRATNPDLWHPQFGGEKPMELAYFNAVIRSTSLPPFDPWFAGGYLNYYYWGYFVLAGIVHLTGILPTTAFNLAVSLFFALTVTGAYSIVYNLCEGVRRARIIGAASPSTAHVAADWSNSSRWRSSLGSPVGAGLTAGLFVAVIGNLDGVIQIIQSTWYKLADGRNVPSFDFWRSSRMLEFQENIDPSPLAFWVPDKVEGFVDRSPHITEFPFFTFLYGDLHAHMMAIPFTLLVIGLGLSLVAGLRSGSNIWTVVTAGALALALGSLWVINSWDYPSYLLLTVGLVALAVYLRPGRSSVRLLIFVGLVFGVAAVSLLAFLPFHEKYQTFNDGLQASKWQTPIDRFLGIHGLFIFVITIFLMYRVRSTLGLLVGNGLGAMLRRFGYSYDLQSDGSSCICHRGVFGLGLLLAVLLAIAGYWTVVMLLGLLMLTGICVWDILRSRSEERGFETVPLVLLALGLAIAIGVDFIRVDGDIGRMNTLFKYYMEVWVLLSLAAAYMLWQLVDLGLPKPRWILLGEGRPGILMLLIGSSLIDTALVLGLLAVVLLAIDGYWAAVTVLVVLVLIGISVWDILVSKREDRLFTSLTAVLLTVALAITIGVDVIRLEGDIGRMNTHHKYFLELVWVLLSLAVGYMLWLIAVRRWYRSLGTWLGRAWPGVTLMLVCFSLLYTALGTQARIDLRFNLAAATLDGAAYMESAVHRARGFEEQQPVQLKWDYGAIRWLQDNVAGSPVLLEAHNEQYTWSSRISDYTGMPTVLGWPWHQRQQRWDYEYAVFDRAEKVREIYNTTDIEQAQALLQQYGVKYVVVGQLERLYYTQVGLQKFKDLTTQGNMNLVYKNPGVSIYQVN